MILAAMTALYVSTAPGAQTAPPTLGDCLAIENDAERLACYDRLARAALGVPALDPRAPEAPVPAPSAATASSTAPTEPQSAPGADAAAAFGAEDLARREIKGDDTPKKLAVTVTRIVYTDSGKAVFGLSNGQIWIQTEPEGRRRFELSEDEEIEAVLQKRMFGGYWLATKSPRRKIKVERRK
ncbi:MAG: hypothetical protein AAFR11_06545 [Pseudomonadota bacterium]